MIQGALFALQCFIIKCWFVCWTLKTFKVHRIPIWCRRWAHWSCTSFLALFWLVVKIFIRRTLGRNRFWHTFSCKLIKVFLLSTNPTSLFYLIVERLFITTLITTVCLIIPERSFRRTKWMCIVALHNTFFSWLIKVVTFTAFLLRRFTNSWLLIPCLILVTFSALFHDRVKIWCLCRTRLTWVAERIPKWSIRRTWTLICVGRLLWTFSDCLIKILSFRAVCIIATDMGS